MQRFHKVGLALVLFYVAGAAQYPVLDMIANKVVQKYEQSSCEQLWEKRNQQQGQPKSQKEQDFIGMLRSDPQKRAAFLNKVAGPIANKMFECGMIP